MGEPKGFCAAILALIGVFAAGLCLASPALAATGVITRAEASPDWTHASIAGSVTWTGCEHSVTPPQPPRESHGPEEPEGGLRSLPASESATPPHCGWRPFAALSPNSNCESVISVTVWSEAERIDLATASFDLPEVPLDGQPGQYLCVGVTEIAQTGNEIPCVPPGEPVPTGWHCPYETADYLHLLASAPLTAEATQGTEPSTHPRHPRRCAKYSGSRRSRCLHHRHRHRRHHGNRRQGNHGSAKTN